MVNSLSNSRRYTLPVSYSRMEITSISYTSNSLVFILEYL